MKLIFVLILMASMVRAGTLTETRTTLGSVHKITLTWSTPTNAAAGVSGTMDLIAGTFDRVVFPLTSASTGAIYSVTIKAAGVDLLNSLATTLPTNAITQFAPVANAITAQSVTSAIPWKVSDQCSVVVTNCGSNALGTVILYVTP